MKKKYEIVLLDIDDTIFDYRKTETYAMNKVFEDFGYFKNNTSEDLKKFRDEYKIINLELWKNLEKGTITLDELKIERFRKTFDIVGIKYNPEEFSNGYLKRLGEGIFLFEGAEKFLDYISEKYKIVIVTNGIKEVQIPRIQNSPLIKYINEVVISEEIGVNKPNPLIFQKALEKIGYIGKKENVIMIGDSQTADIQGAINFGIDSCWIRLLGQKKINSIIPTYTIEKYEDISIIL